MYAHKIQNAKMQYQVVENALFHPAFETQVHASKGVRPLLTRQRTTIDGRSARPIVPSTFGSFAHADIVNARI